MRCEEGSAPWAMTAPLPAGNRAPSSTLRGVPLRLPRAPALHAPGVPVSRVYPAAKPPRLSVPPCACCTPVLMPPCSDCHWHPSPPPCQLQSSLPQLRRHPRPSSTGSAQTSRPAATTAGSCMMVRHRWLTRYQRCTAAAAAVVVGRQRGVQLPTAPSSGRPPAAPPSSHGQTPPSSSSPCDRSRTCRVSRMRPRG